MIIGRLKKSFATWSNSVLNWINQWLQLGYTLFESRRFNLSEDFDSLDGWLIHWTVTITGCSFRSTDEMLTAFDFLAPILPKNSWWRTESTPIWLMKSHRSKISCTRRRWRVPKMKSNLNDESCAWIIRGWTPEIVQARLDKELKSIIERFLRYLPDFAKARV